MRTSLIICGCALLGCSEVSGLSDFTAETASSAGGTASSGGMGGTPVATGGGGGGESMGEFTLVGPVDAINTTSNEDDPTFTPDGLELFFNRTNPSDIMRSTRAAIDDPWGTPVSVGELNSGSSDSNPVISSDGMTIWFASQRNGGLGSHDIYVATRTAVGAMFTMPVSVAEVSSDRDDIPSFVSGDGLLMLLMRRASVMSDSPLELYRTRRDSPSDAWATPVREQQAFRDDLDPWMSGDGLTVFVRTGSDIGMAVRTVRTEPFGMVVALPELDANGDVESDPWLLPDTSYIMFTRMIGNDSDIWEAYR